MTRWTILPGAQPCALRPAHGSWTVLRRIIWLIVLSLLLSACVASTEPLQSNDEQAGGQSRETLQPGIKPTRTPFPTQKAYGGTRTPTLNPSEQPGGSETVAPQSTVEGGVVMLAFGGSLNVRRGPGLAYDTVAAFETGQSTQPVGRDANGEWLQVEVPGSSGVYGWVYSKAPTVVVSGDALTLPEAAYNEAVPAYVRNCTSHQIALRPGELILEPITQQPANRIQVNPGFYEVVDLTLNGVPITTISVTEGSELVVTLDGNGVTHTCPR